MMSPVSSLIPAVSINRNKIPSMFINSSIVSLVVPAMSLTIALFSFNKLFSNVLLPALGFPTMATRTPFRITFPYLNDSIKRSVTFNASLSS
jgi:hypothetical protein